MTVAEQEPAIQEPEKKQKKPTRYVVLGLNSEGLWDVLGEFEGSKNHVLTEGRKKDDSCAQYVAVPKRSWRPKVAKPMTIERLTFE